MDVFTPLNSDRTKRLRFNGSDIEVISGNLNVRKRGVKATVRINDTMYRVIGIGCGLPNCLCDARIEETAA